MKNSHNKSNRLRSVLILISLLLVSLIVVVFVESKRLHPAEETKVVSNQNINSHQEIGNVSENSNTEATLPEKILIKVPFTVQAPNANWDAVHEEACEEASLIMLKHFIKKEPIGSAEQVEAEIQSMIKYETDNGYKQDVSMDELAQIAEGYYGLKTARVEKHISLDDIKKELAAGRPVIVPASGKMLDNPNFRNGGPLYHSLVIVGYDEKGFITNDPGTRKGEGFRYSFDNLFNAMHDWNATDINQGQKAYFVFD